MSETARRLRLAEEREARRTMLDQPHVTPLTNYVRELRNRSVAEFPDFDPADGGINASMLFLFEKPGPMTSAAKAGREGSGFISRDNDDPTAEATFNFMRQAGIPREATVIWNVVPGWNGTRAITTDELRAGVAEVQNLLDLLPSVKTIVLVGKKAQRAERHLRSARLAVFCSPHPSPLVRASQPEQWSSISQIWAGAKIAVGPVQTQI